MLRHLMLSMCVGLAGLALPALAADPAREIVEKAVKAHGGVEKVTKFPVMQVKARGTIKLNADVPFTQESTAGSGGRYKEVMELDVNNQKVKVATVFDGQKGWIVVNGQELEVTDAILQELKEASHMLKISRMLFSLDKNVALSPLGEMQVNGRPAVGVKASAKGFRDVDLYFDKATGLFAKLERRTVDIMKNQEVTEERIITEYQVVDGVQSAKKATVNRDGKKFIEMEIVELKHLEKVDDSEFAKP